MAQVSVSTFNGSLPHGTIDGSNATPAVVEGNFPASWYTQPLFYELERRAIFTKHWLLTSHRVRFPIPGSYVRFEIAGIDLFIIKDRHDNIQAFHNVCRHRAYPLIDKNDPDHGSKQILSCGYHGWSYGLSGNLAKAPKFDEVEGFNKDEYSLFKIHTHVDKVGFIWINLDASETPVPWDTLNGGSDEQERYNAFDFEKYVYEETWCTHGLYNWKVVGENYNECYHCNASHPGIKRITNLDRYAVVPVKGRLEAYPPDRDDVKPEDIKYFGNGAFTYNYPNNAVNMSTPYFFIMRVVPTSATTVTTEYQVFRNSESLPEMFDQAAEFFKGIELEDYDLCNGVQKNLNSGVFVTGPLHTSREMGVLYFKELVKQHVESHAKAEAKDGHEIWPARRAQQLHKNIDAEEKFAAGVCGVSCACMNGTV